MKKIKGFEKEMDAYKARLKLLREVVSSGSQQDFADKIGIDMKRWNNYERGYPIPREIAFLLREKLKEPLAEWLWWGLDKHLSPQFKAKLKTAEQRIEARAKQEAELAAAKKAYETLKKAVRA
ncbi:transcriptional regulator with XRE-family HTH domain [Bradyrhizobium sp. USDA 372]